MKLCECTMGTLVVAKDNPMKIGHVVGLAYNYDISTILNCRDRNTRGLPKEVEVIPVIRFVREQTDTKIHYGNIDKFKAY